MKLDDYSKTQLKKMVVAIAKEAGYVLTNTDIETMEFREEETDYKDKVIIPFVPSASRPELYKWLKETRNKIQPNMFSSNTAKRNTLFKEKMAKLFGIDNDVESEFAVAALQIANEYCAVRELDMLNMWCDLIYS
jgi:hypothetical protein